MAFVGNCFHGGCKYEAFSQVHTRVTIRACGPLVIFSVIKVNIPKAVLKLVCKTLFNKEYNLLFVFQGIFGVPREKCVEQYYKAAMSFCSTYKCKNLREIHFVDRDESIVRAIKEVFQQKQPATSTTAMFKNLLKQDDTMEDTKSLDVKNKTEMPASMPPSSGYTIVTVSDTLQIKIYLGSITDIAADAIVCPQDEFCSSDNPIARSIFSKEPGPKPLRNQMKQGQTLSQIPSDASPWKMIIHAVFPIYSDNYAKNPSKFGSQFYPMFQTLITTADERRYHSIAIPLLVEGILFLE